ncbi:MAG: carboxylating nicotinate-nucleotide diphosphorylase [Phycisphaerales bacterium]
MQPLDLNTLPLPDLYFTLARSGLVRALIELARDEDIGFGHPGSAGADPTSFSIGDPRATMTAHVNAREAMTVAGLETVPEIIRAFKSSVMCEALAADGDAVEKGRMLATLTGPRREVLMIERTLLNLVSRLSGVATLTRAFVTRMNAEAPGTRARLFDTRKTTPGLRMLEKYAVRCGGGFCHRLGLYDAVLFKDNHVAALAPGEFARAIALAASRAKQSAGTPMRFFEVEVDSLEQLDALLHLQPEKGVKGFAGGGTIEFTLLDNMTSEQLREAVRRRDHAPTDWARHIQLEASGGVRLETIGAIAATGVERISCGALTHQAVSVDIGLDAG